MRKYLLLGLLLCSGCSLPLPSFLKMPEPAIEPMPVIKVDARPKYTLKAVEKAMEGRSLVATEKELLDALDREARYSRIRDARIEAYNVYARSRNELFDSQKEELK